MHALIGWEQRQSQKSAVLMEKCTSLSFFSPLYALGPLTLVNDVHFCNCLVALLILRPVWPIMALDWTSDYRTNLQSVPKQELYFPNKENESV
jgi:hypothetical protein